MTPEELKNLIQSDPQALSLAQAGAADLCAKRCMEIAPKILISQKLTDLGILSLYANPVDGEAVCQQIETIAKTNPVVQRAWKWALPPNDGVDVGNVKVRTLLTTPVASGGIGLSPVQAEPILSVAEVAPNISGADVSTAFPYPENQGV